MAGSYGNQRCLTGQLLFADVGDEEVVLDGVLAPVGRSVGAPMSLRAGLIRASRQSAVDALKQWAAEGSAIGIVEAEGENGRRLVISSDSSRVELRAVD